MPEEKERLEIGKRWVTGALKRGFDGLRILRGAKYSAGVLLRCEDQGAQFLGKNGEFFASPILWRAVLQKSHDFWRISLRSLLHHSLKLVCYL
jgi:hypothetical protein